MAASSEYAPPVIEPSKKKKSKIKRRDSLVFRWFKYISETTNEGKKSTSIRRAPVNKSNLTLNESSDDLGLAQARTDNNNIDQTLKASSETSSLDNEATAGCEASVAADTRSRMAKVFDIPDNDIDTVVEMASELEGETDPKSLLLASINGLNEINDIVSPTALPATSPSPSASLSGSMSSLAPSVSSADTNRIAQITQNVTKRLYNLLELLNDKESKEERLRTAEAILASGAGAETSGDSRPNSFISTASSDANPTESGQEYINPSITEPSTEPGDSGASNHHSTSSDSDEEGTVYADTCEDLTLAATVDSQSTLTREKTNEFNSLQGVGDTEETTSKDCLSKSLDASEDNSEKDNELVEIDDIVVEQPISDTEDNGYDIIDTDNASNNNSNLDYNSPTIDVHPATDSDPDNESESGSDSDTVAESPELSESVKAYVESLITDAVDMVIHNSGEVGTILQNAEAGFTMAETAAAGDAFCMTSLD